MKHTLLFGAITSIFAINVAMADTVVTSKTYVDGRDALKVDIAQGTGDNNANVGKTLVVNSSGNLELGTPAAGNYVEDSITDGVTNKAPSENAVHDALADKQDKITTAEVGMNGYDLPALVSYDTTNGLVGNRIGILDQETVADDELDLSIYNDLNYPDGEMDNYVPTVRAVANGLEAKQDAISTAEVEFYNAPNDTTWSVPALVTYDTSNGMVGNNVGIVNLEALEGESARAFDSAIYDHFIPSLRVVSDGLEKLWDNRITWSSDETTAVNNYSTSFDGTTGDWPTNDRWHFIDGPSLAQGLALKQNRQIGASPVGNANSTDAGKILVVGNDGKIAMSAATNPNNFQTKIPARATKIESTDSTYAPSVVTNGATDGSVGQMAILTNARVSVEDGADGNAFADYTNADSLIPTAAAVGAELGYKQAKKVCAGWPDGAEHTDANCWLWNMPD